LKGDVGQFLFKQEISSPEIRLHCQTTFQQVVVSGLLIYMNKFKPKICSCCGQSEEYLISLDKGSCLMLLDLLRAISVKEINEIHPTRELNWSGKKQWYITNLSKLRFHGLIAYIDREEKAGYYCLTRKAGQFLRGGSIPKYAIISKITRHQEGYFDSENRQVSLQELLKSDLPNWEYKELSIIDYLNPNKDLQTPLF